jgi:hypothetical protein
VLLHLRRTALTLALAAGLALGTAGAASAQSLTINDARGDVKAFDMDTDEPTATTGTVNGDALRTVLRHADRQVFVRVKFADLRRTGDGRADFVRVVTNEGVRRDIWVSAGPGMWRGQAQMTRPNGRSVACKVAHRIDYDTNVTTVSFPRSCVSDPRWVQLGVGSTWVNQTANEYYADDALLSGRINPETLRLSPRIRRG